MVGQFLNLGLSLVTNVELVLIPIISDPPIPLSELTLFNESTKVN